MSLEPPLDPAAQAFERLRLEIALLRRAVEGLAGEGGREPVDYSPTLARLGKAVAAVDERLQAIEALPALALAPEQRAQLLLRAADNMLARPLAELGHDRAAFAQGLGALRAVTDGLVAHRARWRLAAITGVTGLVVGAAAWAALLGPVARALPERWQVPERLAAATLGMPRPMAGSRLLQQANPEAWRQSRASLASSGADPADSETCRRRPGRSGAIQRSAARERPASQLLDGRK